MRNTGLIAVVALTAALPLFALTNFSGTWELNVSKSKNIGMMGQMKLVATIHQTTDEILITNASTFNGKEGTGEIRLDLNGRSVPNKNPMEAEAQTLTKWDGPKLVTTWSSPGSIAGTTSVRIETRWLSVDGRTLTVESRRGSSPPMTMVYDRK